MKMIDSIQANSRNDCAWTSSAEKYKYDRIRKAMDRASSAANRACDCSAKVQIGFLGVPTIKKVIFNPPATIVIWTDGEKTVVKAYKEPFDPEKGLAMAISNHILSLAGVNPHRFFRENLKKYLSEDASREWHCDFDEVRGMCDALAKADGSDEPESCDSLVRFSAFRRQLLDERKERDKEKNEENPDK